MSSRANGSFMQHFLLNVITLNQSGHFLLLKQITFITLTSMATPTARKLTNKRFKRANLCVLHQITSNIKELLSHILTLIPSLL